MKPVFEIPVETRQVLHIETMFCAVPYLDMSQLLRLHVIDSFLSGATLSKVII